MTAVNAPGLLLSLEAKIKDLERSSIPRLQQSVVGLRESVNTAEEMAKVAAGAVEAAHKVVIRADEKAAAAELAWQNAEDRVDALLQKHNSLMVQIATMAEFFQKHGSEATTAAEPTPSQVQADLESLAQALQDTRAQVMSIQSTKQDTAATLAEVKLLAEQQVAAAAAAESKFRAAAAQLAASKAVAARLQQQLEHARKQLQLAGDDLTNKQEAAAAAMLDVQGKQAKLVQAVAAAKAARARQEEETTALAAAVSASLASQAKLSAAMAELQNLKAEEKNIILDLTASEEQQRRLDSLLASANASATTAQVNRQALMQTCYICRHPLIAAQILLHTMPCNGAYTM